jgi:hypothetical protein
MPLRLAVLLAIGVLAVAAPGAFGASVSARVELIAQGGDNPDIPVFVIRVRGARGEANDLSLSWTAGVLALRDAGAPLRVSGRACRRTGSDSARCAAPDEANAPQSVVEVDAGDRSDVVRLRVARGQSGFGVGELNVPATRLSGGPGSDRLAGAGDQEGGPGDDVLVGTPEDDSLVGGAGEDELIGGRGDDELFGDGPSVIPEPPPVPSGDDRIDGGMGTDTVHYDERKTAVMVDLQAGFAGEAGERDRLRRVENAEGGSGADVLLGDAHANRLMELGSEAGDIVRGRGGADELWVTGAGAAFGDAGDDYLIPMPSLEEGGAVALPALSGGPGEDRVSVGSTFGEIVTVPEDCEQAVVGIGSVSLRPEAVGGGTVRVQLAIHRSVGIRGHPLFRLRLVDAATGLVATGAARVRSRRVTVLLKANREIAPGPLDADVTVRSRGAVETFHARLRVVPAAPV